MNKFLLLAAFVWLTSGCYNDKGDKLYPKPATSTTTCDTTTITYSHDIAPIIKANCAISGGCHNAADHSASGYDYETSTAAIISNAKNGLLLPDINFAPRHNAMPKNASKLADCDINKITRWVNLGALNN